jgi:hypothetical protein
MSYYDQVIPRVGDVWQQNRTGNKYTLEDIRQLTSVGPTKQEYQLIWRDEQHGNLRMGRCVVDVFLDVSAGPMGKGWRNNRLTIEGWLHSNSGSPKVPTIVNTERQLWSNSWGGWGSNPKDRKCGLKLTTRNGNIWDDAAA